MDPFTKVFLVAIVFLSAVLMGGALTVTTYLKMPLKEVEMAKLGYIELPIKVTVHQNEVVVKTIWVPREMVKELKTNF
jgi:hypothetical protein